MSDILMKARAALARLNNSAWAGDIDAALDRLAELEKEKSERWPHQDALEDNWEALVGVARGERDTLKARVAELEVEKHGQCWETVDKAVRESNALASERDALRIRVAELETNAASLYLEVCGERDEWRKQATENLQSLAASTQANRTLEAERDALKARVAELERNQADLVALYDSADESTRLLFGNRAWMPESERDALCTRLEEANRLLKAASGYVGVPTRGPSLASEIRAHLAKEGVK